MRAKHRCCHCCCQGRRLQTLPSALLLPLPLLLLLLLQAQHLLLQAQHLLLRPLPPHLQP
jgi:hypothetical protein